MQSINQNGMKYEKYIFMFQYLLLIGVFQLTAAPIQYDSSMNVLNILQDKGVWYSSKPLKLHLGCGEQKFTGYINIDFPPSQHTVQVNSVADMYADITELKFPFNSVDEVRSHHVFEHFDRPTAVALLCKWHQWLKVGGVVTIETPDFEACLKKLVDSKYSYLQKQVVMRHLYGSHEAPWAIHCDGWYAEKFQQTLTILGFKMISVKPCGQGLIPNVLIQAQKVENIETKSLLARAGDVLRHSMVDTTSSEEKMWRGWCDRVRLVLK